MEAVIFDGKEYVKASVVAERFKYTQDYLGQLCRGKKIDARLVGRAWYINLDSLQGHKKNRYKTVEKAPHTEIVAEAKPPTPHSVRGNYLSRIDVEPVLKKKTVKIIKNESGKLSEFPVKYENDDYSLIPKVSKEAVFKSIPILPAEAKDMPVQATKDSVRVTAFKAEPLPEVFLKGVLKVDGIAEVIEEQSNQEDDVKNVVNQGQIAAFQDKTSHISPKPHSKHTTADIKKPIKIKLYRNTAATSDAISKNTKQQPAAPGLLLKRVTTEPLVPVAHTSGRQISVKRVEESKGSPGLRPENQPKPLQEIQRIPYATTKALVLLLLCLTCAGCFLVLKSELVLDEGSWTEAWIFSDEIVHNSILFLTTFGK